MNVTTQAPQIDPQVPGHKTISWERLLTLKMAGTSRSSVQAMINKGLFPAPIDLGFAEKDARKCRKGFILAEVDAWIEARMAERDTRKAGA